MSRPSVLRRAGVLTAITGGVLCALLAQHGAAGAAQSLTVGRTFSDGLTTTLGAQRMASALSAVGYTNRAYHSGTTAATVYDETLSANVFYMFMHANAGFMTTHEDQYLIADDRSQLGAVTGTPVGDPRFRKLSSYLELVDIDDIKIMFFAGCDTYQTSPNFGHLPTVARAKGVDATVSYPGLVYGASSSAANKDYSGNYYWGRAAYYLQIGNTLYNALDKARADIVTKEGNASGWNTFRIGGAVANPSAVKITPAGKGHEYDSIPVVMSTPSLDQLTVTASRPESIDGVEVVDEATAEGYHVRRSAATGEVVGLFATPSSTGETTLDEDAALARATRFLQDNVAAFGSDFVLTSRGPAAHLDDDVLSAFQWRTQVGGVRGPRSIEVEVDRRTGAITYLNVAKPAATAPGLPTMTHDEAVAAARAIAGPAGAATAVADVWDRARWTVTVDRGVAERGWRDAVEIVLDARTGDLLAQRHS